MAVSPSDPLRQACVGLCPPEVGLVWVKGLAQAIELPQRARHVQERLHAYRRVAVFEAAQGGPGDAGTVGDLLCGQALQFPPRHQMLTDTQRCHAGPR